MGVAAFSERLKDSIQANAEPYWRPETFSREVWMADGRRKIIVPRESVWGLVGGTRAGYGRGDG